MPQLNSDDLYNGGAGAAPANSGAFGGSHFGYGNIQCSLFSNENRMRNENIYSDPSVRSKLQGLSGNTEHLHSVGYGTYSSPYTIPNGYVVNPDPTGNRTHIVRKLPTDGGNNKENRVEDSVVSIDGYTGRSLLDAFYNKDIKSKTAVARLSDGDTASFSSGCSKSSTENMSPSHSPLASISSTPRSVGAFSMNIDSSSSSSSQKEHEEFSPPKAMFRSPRQQPGACGALRRSPPQSVFRNSSGSDGSARSSPPQSLFRTAPHSYVNTTKTSPPSSMFRFAATATATAVVAPTTAGHPPDEYFKNSDRLSPLQGDTAR